MAWLKKTKGVPGSAPGALVWNTTEDVVEVDDELAVQLLEIPDAGFVSVVAPETPVESEEPDDGPIQAGESPAKAPAKKAVASKAATSKTPVSE